MRKIPRSPAGLNRSAAKPAWINAVHGGTLIALIDDEATVLRTFILAIALIVGGLPTFGMDCERPNAPLRSASSACRHAAHDHSARVVVRDVCSVSPQPMLIVQEDVRRKVPQPALAALAAAFVTVLPVGDSTLPATSPAARQHPGWRGSPLVLRI